MSLRLTKHHAIKTYCGSGGITSRILNLGARGGEWSASRSGLFTLGGKNRYPLDRRLDGTQNRSGRNDEKEKSQPLLGIEPR
jgi:hypothetical protein